MAVPVSKAILLLTETKYLRDIRRRKWWKRIVAHTTRQANGRNSQTPRAPRRSPTLRRAMHQAGRVGYPALTRAGA